MKIVFFYKKKKIVLHSDGFQDKKKSRRDNLSATKKLTKLFETHLKYLKRTKGKNSRKYLAFKKQNDERKRRDELSEKFNAYRNKGLNYFEDFPKNEAIESHNLWVKHILQNAKKIFNDARKLINYNSLFIKQLNLKYSIKKNNLSENEKIYLDLFSNYALISLSRLDYLFKNFSKDFNQKNYVVSMFSLRGFLETSYFDTYVTHTLYKHIKDKNFDKFLDLFLRANFASQQSSMNIISSALYDKKLRKIIGNYRGKRIHINDTIKYFELKNFSNLMNKYEKTKLKKNNNGHNFFSLIQNSIIQKIKKDNFNFSFYKDGYHRLCEIIHPTALYMNKHDDIENKSDFYWIVGRALHTSFVQMIVFNTLLKKNILDEVLQNKEIILKNLRKI